MKKRNLVFFIQIACIIVAPLFLCENQNSQNDSILATVKAQNGQQETFYPHLIGKKNLGIIYDIFVAENYAYVTNNDALVIVDIHNLARPKKISVIEVEGGVFGVSVRNDLAYIATDDSHEFLIADVSNPANPTIIGSYQANDELRRVELDGNFAYVVSFNEGLLIFNIQDPTNPTLVGQFNDGGQGTGVAISGDIAFFTDVTDGLEVLDISNKSSPHEIATLIEYYGAFDVEIHGDLLYMACYSYGIRILNISNPLSPIVISSLGKIPTSEEVPRSRAVSGDLNFLYVAELETGVKLLNVTDPTNPYEIAHYDKIRPINCLYDGQYVYIAGSQAFRSFHIVEFTTEPLKTNQNLWYLLLLAIPLLAVIPLFFLFRSKSAKKSS